MNIFFHPVAQKELEDAVKYYNKCGSGLGYIFLDEIEITIQRIVEFSYTWISLSENTRRCLSRRFPYGIIYQILNNDNILIVAIMHMKKKPNYWRNRVRTV